MPDIDNRRPTFLNPHASYTDSPSAGLTMPTSKSEEEIKQLILQAMANAQKVDPQSLTPDSRYQYDALQKFLEIAQQHLQTNPRLAATLADKAHVMSQGLAPRGQQTPLTDLIRPFLKQ